MNRAVADWFTEGTQRAKRLRDTVADVFERLTVSRRRMFDAVRLDPLDGGASASRDAGEPEMASAEGAGYVKLVEDAEELPAILQGAIRAAIGARCVPVIVIPPRFEFEPTKTAIPVALEPSVPFAPSRDTGPVRVPEAPGRRPVRHPAMLRRLRRRLG
jgi:hypothetical protein